MLGAQVETFQKALESHKDHKYVEVLYRLSTLEPYHKQPKSLFHVPLKNLVDLYRFHLLLGSYSSDPLLGVHVGPGNEPLEILGFPCYFPVMLV